MMGQKSTKQQAVSANHQQQGVEQGGGDRDSLRFQCLSDVHLEFTQGKFTVPPRKAPYLALLGDIGATGKTGEGMTHIKDFILACLSQGGFQQVWYVLGNHEGYGQSYDAATADLKALEAQVGRDRFALLDRNSVDISLPGNKRVRVLGTVLWSKVPPQHKAEVGAGLNDFKQMSDMTLDRMDSLHNDDVAWLHQECQRTVQENQQALQAGQKNNSAQSEEQEEEGAQAGPPPLTGLLILTHHCPFVDVDVMLPEKDQRAIRFCVTWGVGGADLVPGAFSQEKYPGLALWCYGHTHWNHPIATYGGLGIGTNQVGYPGGGDHCATWKDHQPTKVFSVAVNSKWEPVSLASAGETIE